MVGLELEEDENSSDDSDSTDEVTNTIEDGSQNVIDITESMTKNNNEATNNINEINKTIKLDNTKTSTTLQEQKEDNITDKLKVISKSVKDKVKIKKPLLEHPTVHVNVKRDPKVQVARLKLPVLGEEQRIMELVNENQFLIVAGETGILYTYYLIRWLFFL